MGVTKTELFTEEQNRIAGIAKVLAHPARVAILQHLLKINSCITGELVLETGLAQATISQHLREMKDAGIIKGTIEGVAVNYCIDKSRWNEVRSVLCSLLERTPGSGYPCC